jgi:hypothetical protein
MANRFPLIANSSTQRIEELASNDSLDLTNSPIINAPSIQVTGITTAGSLNIGATQVISSARQLQNIASLDATTTSTIESAIANAPNDFTSLNVTGAATFSATTDSTTKDTGAVVLEGGLGVEKNITAGGSITSSAGTLGTNGTGTRYVSTGNPTGGNNGDIWYKTLT